MFDAKVRECSRRIACAGIDAVDARESRAGVDCDEKRLQLSRFTLRHDFDAAAVLAVPDISGKASLQRLTAHEFPEADALHASVHVSLKALHPVPPP